MRDFEDAQTLFTRHQIEVGRQVRLGFRLADGKEILFPITFEVREFDGYSINLDIIGLEKFIPVDPDCVSDIKDNLILLGECHRESQPILPVSILIPGKVTDNEYYVFRLQINKAP